MNYRYIEHLPVHEKRAEIIRFIQSEQVVIISGETGSGKTTQLPLFCLEAGRGRTGRIGCTQPRRVAAQSLAHFVASQFDKDHKTDVGYRIRFEEHVDDRARIKFLTDGMLLAEAAADPLLREYDTLIIDEVHERTVNIDLLLGFLRLLLPQRPDLHVILSSATFDTSLFSKFFNNAPVVIVDGRLFQIDIQYKPVIELWKGESLDSYIEGVVCAVQEIVSSNEPGDILVFLPTIDDVYDALNKVSHRISDVSARLLALHSRISGENQQKIFDRSTERKIIIATNVAETSITVPGVRFVIDSGLARVLRYDAKSSISRMPIEKISRSSANQRMGRCGRVQNGICIRLYSEQDFLSRPLYTQAEIKRANCAGVILRLYQLNANYVKRFPFIQTPPHNAMIEGYRTLCELGALDKKSNLTHLGRKMASLPLDPSISRILLHSITNDTFAAVSVIAAALSVDRLIIAENDTGKGMPSAYRDSRSDFMTFVVIWNELQKNIDRFKNNVIAIRTFCEEYGFSHVRIREWIYIHQQIIAYCKLKPTLYLNVSDKRLYEKIHKSLLTGMYNGVAVRVAEYVYEGVTTGNIRLFPGSTLFRKNPDWVLCHEIVETGQVYGRYNAVIKPQWIEELFRHQCRYSYTNAWYSAEDGIVKCREEVLWKGLTIVKNRVVRLDLEDRKRASEIFIRDALVNEQIGNRTRFVTVNSQLRDLITKHEQKLRRSIYGGDILLESFYEHRIGTVCSRRELYQLIKEHGEDSFLIAPLEELVIGSDTDELGEFPDSLTIAGVNCKLSYLWLPEDPQDGVTISVREELYNTIPGYYWDWLLPILVQKRLDILGNLLHGDSQTKKMFIEEMKSFSLHPCASFRDTVEKTLCNYNIQAHFADLFSVLPDFLWLNVAVFSTKSGVFYVRAPVKDTSQSYRDSYCSEIKYLLGTHECDQIRWNNPELLEPFFLECNKQTVPLCGYTAFAWESNRVVTRIFLKREQAHSSQIYAVEQLIESTIYEALAWSVESCKVTPLVRQNVKKLFNVEDFDKILTSFIVKYAIGDIDPLPKTSTELDAMVENARRKVVSAGSFAVTLIEQITCAAEAAWLLLNKRILKYTEDRYANIHHEFELELNRYMDYAISEQTPLFYLKQLPVILQTFCNRIDAAFYDYRKYHQKMCEALSIREKVPVGTTFSVTNYYQCLKNWKVHSIIEIHIAAIFTQSTVKHHDRMTIDQLKNMVIDH